VRKEQEQKKKAIADYKRRKLEAEELLANADLADYDEELDNSYGPRFTKQPTDKNDVKLDSNDSFAKSLGIHSSFGGAVAGGKGTAN
jgi:hypothetical protein